MDNLRANYEKLMAFCKHMSALFNGGKLRDAVRFNLILFVIMVSLTGFLLLVLLWDRMVASL